MLVASNTSYGGDGDGDGAGLAGLLLHLAISHSRSGNASFWLGSITSSSFSPIQIYIHRVANVLYVITTV